MENVLVWFLLLPVLSLLLVARGWLGGGHMSNSFATSSKSRLFARFDFDN
jgi:hypothetical protein